MDRVYREIPYNYNKIEKNVVTDRNEIVKEIILANRCYWYDTCAFRNHMNLSCGQLIAQYIKETSGIVVITRTILMELCSADGNLWEEHIAYIEYMASKGIKILLICEEDLFDVLYTYSSDIIEINQWLARAVKCAKSKVGKIENVVKNDKALYKALFETKPYKDKELASKLFSKVRAVKTSGDNMGEELIGVCVHWLSRIRNLQEHKHIVLTDDKKSIAMLGKVMTNVREYYEANSIALCTTAKLCYLMVQKGTITTENEGSQVLEGIVENSNLKVYCSGEYELQPTDRTFEAEEFLKAVLNKKIKVYY